LLVSCCTRQPNQGFSSCRFGYSAVPSLPNSYIFTYCQWSPFINLLVDSGNSTKTSLHEQLLITRTNHSCRQQANEIQIRLDIAKYHLSSRNKCFSEKHIPPYDSCWRPWFGHPWGYPPKWEKIRQRCGRITVQNFTPIGKAPAEKFVTVHIKWKSRSKLSIPPILRIAG